MKLYKRLFFLFAGCSSFFIFHSSVSSAQDTSQPAFISKAAYDSTLRALKKARAVKNDSVLAVKRADSLKKAAGQKDKPKDSRIIADTITGQSATAPNRHVSDSERKAHRERFGYIAFNYGIGLPLSGYATAGSAANGRNYSLCAEFPGITSRYCWTFKFDYGLNGINIPQYLHDVSEYVYPTYQYSMNFPIPSYSYYSIMTGLSRIFPVGRLTFDARVLFGFLRGTAPQTSYNVSDSGKTLTVTQYKCSAWAFAFGFGLDVRYRINSGFSLLLNYDYLTARPSMQLVSFGFNTSPFSPAAPSLSAYTQGFVLNNLTVGVGYAIAGKR